MGGLVETWHHQIIAELVHDGTGCLLILNKNFKLLYLNEGAAVLHLIDLGNVYSADELVKLQDHYLSKGVQLIHLWEDIWRTRREQVLARVRSILGLNLKIHARKTEVVSITKVEADQFLNENHLQLSVGARFKYGLRMDQKLVAVACFSNFRRMQDQGDDYRSVELIRFANLKGVTVTGGFTKLIAHFIKLHQPNDIMSYADRDWSAGAAYQKSGFKLVAITPPAEILLNKITCERIFPHRLSGANHEDHHRIFNTGNLKYILYL